MDSSPRKVDAYSSLWDLDRQPAGRLEKSLERLYGLWQPQRGRFAKAISVYTAVNRKMVSMLAHAAQPVLLRKKAHEEAPREPDSVEMLLREFGGLDQEQQAKVAGNLVLLWDNFQTIFGGLSGFLAASPMEQDAFMEKLEAAARRMEAARGTDSAFHYVTVELIRQYISFFRVGRSDGQALALAARVAALIDEGRCIPVEPTACANGSSARWPALTA
jgi:hypothetical protein